MEAEYVESRISRHLHYLAAEAGIPLSGTFELTPCCNLSCRMCYVRKNRSEVEAQGGLMPASEWIALAEKCRERGMLYLLLTGGEPMTHPQFKEIYTAVRNMGFAVSINTNGTLVDDDMVAFLAANPPARVNMSLYGASRDTYNQLCGVPEAYDKAMYALREMRKAGITVKINYSATQYNAADADGIFAAAKENNCHVQATGYMFPPLRRDESSIGENDRMSPEEDAEFTLECDRRRMTEEEFVNRCMLRINRSKGCLDGECLDAPSERIRCRAGSTAFWVNWNGDITPCGMMTIKAANVREDGFDKAWQAVRDETAKIYMPSKCTNCGDKEVCIVCAASCYCETGRFDGVPEYLCRRTEAIIEASKRACKGYELKEEKNEDKS